jgi:hypothetical protein
VTTTPSLPEIPITTHVSNTSSAAHTFVRSAFQPPEFSITLDLAADVTLTVRGRTFLQPFISTYYFVLISPSSPLAAICPPHKDGYIDVSSLVSYLRIACVKSITHDIISRLGEDRWILGATGSVIQDQGGTAEMRFDVKTEHGQPVFSLVHVAHRGQPELKEYVWKDNEQESVADTLLQRVEEIIEQGKVTEKTR